MMLTKHVLAAFAVTLATTAYAVVWQPAGESTSPQSRAPDTGARSSRLPPVHSFLLANATTNADGGHTIRAGQHAAEANLLHARTCARYGGRDITDESDVTTGPGTVDAAVCIMDQTKAGYQRKSAQAANSNGPSVSALVQRQGGVAVQPYAITGLTPIDQTYSIEARTLFTSLPSNNQYTLYAVAHEAEICYAQQTGYLGPTASSLLSVVLTCDASLPRVPTGNQACWGNVCQTTNDEITHF